MKEQIVLLQATDGEVTNVLYVKNFDDKFAEALADGLHAWGESDETMEAVVLPALAKAGYIVHEKKDFVSYQVM